MTKKNDKIIKSITLNLNGKTVSLTVDQAKLLQKSLNEMFGKEIVREEHHHHHNDWYWWWEYPTPRWEYQPTIEPFTTEPYTTCVSATYDGRNQNLTLSL